MASKLKKNKLISLFFVFLLIFSIIPLANAEEISLVYDANGNLIQDANFYYEYNSLNQLTQIRDKNAQERIIDIQGRTITLSSDKSSVEVGGHVATITANSSSVNRFRWGILGTNPSCYIAYGPKGNAGSGPVVTNPALIRGIREGTCTVTVMDTDSIDPRKEVVTYVLDVRESAPATGRIIAKYTYDYNGNRILKELFDAQGKSSSIYYPDESFVMEVDEKTKAVNDIVYYYDDSDLVAKKENNKISYYHPDHLGSTSVVTDEQSNIIENNHYLPFGEILEESNERYLYTGQESDPESKLYYYGARYYSPYLAKFTQPDTIIQDIYNPQNLNRYSYVLNNPYKYNDPSGHSPTLITAAIGAGVGLLIGGSFSIAEQYFTTGEIDWKQVGISASIGAVSGGVAGLTLGLGNAAIGMAGLTGTSATVAGGTVAATSSIIGGQGTRAGYNVAEGREITEGLGNPKDMALDAGIGAVTFGIGRRKLNQNKNTIGSEKIKTDAPFTRELPDGRIRNYGKLRLSTNLGPTIGARHIKEMDNFGNTLKHWEENYNKYGEIIQIHHKYPKDLGHMIIDPKTGRVVKWKP